MGVFYEQVRVVNRTTRRLNVRYDGQDIELEPDYDEQGNRLPDVVNMIPRVAIPYALGQNPVMGSESVLDPSRFLSLIGIVDPKDKGPKKSWYDCSFFDEKAWAEEKGTDALTRVPLSELLEDDPQVKNTLVRGRRAEVEAIPTEPFNLRVS